MERPRKEILVLDGLTILGIAMIIVNGTIAGFLYRYHNSQVFEENLKNRAVYGELLQQVRNLKNVIVEKEGAPNWESTTFEKELAFRYRGKKTYMNTEMGIAFDYPADYVESRSEGKGASVTLVSSLDVAARTQAPDVASEGPVTITLEFFPKKGLPLKEWIQNSPESNFSLSNGNLEAQKLSGFSALVYKWSGLYEATSYALETKDSIALLSVTYITRSDDIVRDFDLVLSTVRKVK